MTDLGLMVIMQLSLLAAGEQEFSQAYRQSLAAGRPLVVLVGARWCPACQTMKNRTIPEVAQAGGLNSVVFTYVDFDRQQQIASQLIRGKPIPQLIRFDQTREGPKSSRIVGAKSSREVYEFINTRREVAGTVDKIAANDVPKPRSPKTISTQTAQPVPPASRPGESSVVDAPSDGRREGETLAGEKAIGLSRWMVVFRKLFSGNDDRSERPAMQAPISQAIEDADSDHPREARKTSTDRSPFDGGDYVLQAR